MSLINDALRRASQSDKNRPRPASTPTGMEPAATPQRSSLPIILAAVVLVAVLLAGWFFWQWWNARLSNTEPVVVAHVAPPVAPVPAPVVPVASAKPAPPPIVVPAPPAVIPPTAPAPAAWPVQLKLSAIFFNESNPKAMINGNLYGTGDEIQGVVLKKIEKDKVTAEWNGQSKILMLE